jgi:hypothetical protein
VSDAKISETASAHPPVQKDCLLISSHLLPAHCVTPCIHLLPIWPHLMAPPHTHINSSTQERPCLAYTKARLHPAGAAGSLVSSLFPLFSLLSGLCYSLTNLAATHPTLTPCRPPSPTLRTLCEWRQCWDSAMCPPSM